MIKKVFAALLTLLLLSPALLADGYNEAETTFKNSELVRNYFDNAYAYALFPTVGKGGFIFGGAYGKGRVYRNAVVTGNTTLTHLSVGLQIGGQAYSEIIFFRDQEAYERFTDGSFEFDAAASAVAVTASAHARTGTTGNSVGVSTGPENDRQFIARYVKGMAIFVHSKGGLMFDASVGGQKFSFSALQ